MNREMREALCSRAELMEQRAVDLAHGAITAGEEWVRALPSPRRDQTGREVWSRMVTVVAAYPHPESTREI